MLEQTRQAISALKAVGLERKDFSVSTERHTFIYEGRRVTEYGDAIITLWISKEKAIVLIPAFLENGLDVTIYKFKDGHCGYPHVTVAIENVGNLKEKEV